MLQRTERWPWPLLSPASAWLQCEKSLDGGSELLSGTVFLSTRLAMRTAFSGGAGLPLIGEHALGRPPAVTGCVWLTQELASFIHIFQSLVRLGVFPPLITF